MSITIASPSPAAPPPSSLPSKDSASYRAEGNAAAEAGRHKDALKAWHAAWKSRPGDASLACDIGRAELVTGNNVAAAEWLSRCVRLKPNTTVPTMARRRDEVTDLKLAKSYVVTLTIDVEPGAAITIDGADVGQSPLSEPVFANPGARRIEARKGSRSAVATLKADAGTQRHIALALSDPNPRPSRVASPTPQDRRATSPSPTDRRLPAADPSFRWWPVVVGGALTITGAGLGAAFTSTSRLAETEASETKKTILDRTRGGCGDLAYDPLCSGYAASDARRVALDNAATAAFIVTTVAGAATIAYVAFETHRVSVAPTLGGFVGRYVW